MTDYYPRERSNTLYTVEYSSYLESISFTDFHGEMGSKSKLFSVFLWCYLIPLGRESMEISSTLESGILIWWFSIDLYLSMDMCDVLELPIHCTNDKIEVLNLWRYLLHHLERILSLNRLSFLAWFLQIHECCTSSMRYLWQRASGSLVWCLYPTLPHR